MDADALDLLLPTSTSLLFSNTSVRGSNMFSATTSYPVVLANSLTTAATNGDDLEAGIMKVPAIKALFLLAYILVFFSCVIGNSMILIVIIANRSMRTITNFFLANLAIADLLVGIFCVCQNAAHFVVFEHGTWPFGRILCHAYVYILHMIPNSSAGILVLLSIERFIAVLRPMLVHHLMTKTVLILCAFLVWLFSALMNLPYLIAVQYIELKNAETMEHYGVLVVKQLNLMEASYAKKHVIVTDADQNEENGCVSL